MEVKSQDARTKLKTDLKNGLAHFGVQPVVLGVCAMIAVLLSIGTIGLWRAYSGTSPEMDRAAATRQYQARAAQASEQLVEKTKGLAYTQQESIDQLQVVQDQLKAVKGLLAAEQDETRRLAGQVADLTTAIDNLRQSFASVQSTEDPAPKHSKSSRARRPASAARASQSR